MDNTDKKIEIINAARECFARYGFEKTTMDDIGKLVGLNKASLYYYYKNKESIFAEVILLEAKKFHDSLKDKISKIETCRDKIITYVIGRLRYMRNVVNLHKLSIETAMSFQPIFIDLLKKFRTMEIKLLSEVLKCCINKKEIKECDTEKVAESILSVVDGIKQKAVNCVECKFASDVDYTQIEDEVVFTVSLIMDGLKK